MPNVDESQQERETYGAAPGWGTSQSTRDPNSAPPGAPETSPVSDAESAPSAEPQEASPEQVSEQGTSPSTQPEQPKQWNMPPAERWDELRRQREEAERRAAKAEEMARMALERVQAPQQPVIPESDPWNELVNHPDPATARFYQQQRKVIEATAEQIANRKLAHVQQFMQQGEQELLALKVSQFRRENNIKPNSPEEAAMLPFVQRGFDLETAYKLAKFEQLQAELNTLKGKQAAIPRKVAAGNSEVSSGIPAGSGLPARQSTPHERAGAILDKGGNLKDAVKAFFG